MAHAAHGVAEKVLRNINADACAISGLAVGIDGAAVVDRLQCADRHLDDFAARRAVDLCDKADAARVLLFGGVVGVGGDQRVALFGVAFEPFLAGFFVCHDGSPGGWKRATTSVPVTRGAFPAKS